VFTIEHPVSSPQACSIVIVDKIIEAIVASNNIVRIIKYFVLFFIFIYGINILKGFWCGWLLGKLFPPAQPDGELGYQIFLV
jgi:hypothetical protein